MSVVFRLKPSVKEESVQEILSAIEEAGFAPKRAFPTAGQGPLTSVYLVQRSGPKEVERVRELIESVAPGALDYIEATPPRHRA